MVLFVILTIFTYVKKLKSLKMRIYVHLNQYI